MTTTMREVPMDENLNLAGRHRVRFLVRHPRMDLTFLSNSTGLSPDLNWIYGTERRTPAGNVLPGTHQNSTWSHSVQLKQLNFASAVEQLLDSIEKAAHELVEVSTGGGTASLVLDLDGRSNIGDSLSPRLLARIAAIGIELGVEVFPNSDIQP
jgi:hypothetical protein